MEKIKKHRPNSITRRLRRMEDKLDVILFDIKRLNTLPSLIEKIERQQREDYTDELITKLRAVTQSAKDMAEKEAEELRKLYGTGSI